MKRIRLRVGATAAIISTITDEAKKGSIPNESFESAVLVISTAITHLRYDEKNEAEIVVFESAFELAAINSRQAEFASMLVPVCLKKPYNERILTTKADDLQTLLINPAMSSGTRAQLLATLGAVKPILEIFGDLADQLNDDIALTTNTSQTIALIDATSQAIIAVPQNLDAEGNQSLKISVKKVFAAVKRALMSRDPKIKISGAKCLLSLLLRNDVSRANLVLDEDLGEFLVSALNSVDNEYLQIIFRCISRLARSKSSGLYSRRLTPRLVQSLSRALQLLIAKPNDPSVVDAAHAGLNLLAMIFKFSRNKESDQSFDNAQVISLLSQILLADEDDVTRVADLRTPAALILSEFLLLIPQGQALTCSNLLELLRASDNYMNVKDSPQECICYGLRLVRGAIQATSDDNSTLGDNVLEWAEEVVIEHTMRCLTKEVVGSAMLRRLVFALEQLYGNPNWKNGLSMARTLVTKGFLLYVHQIVNDKQLNELGPKMITCVLMKLLEPHLPDTHQFTSDTIRDGLLDLPVSWFDAKMPPQCSEARKAALAVAFCHVLASPTNEGKSVDILPGLMNLLKSPLSSADHLTAVDVKIVLLLLACAKADPPQRVQDLLVRWAPAAHLVYTHHVSLLHWILRNSDSPLELRNSFVAEWLAHGESPESVADIIKNNIEYVVCVLDVIKGDKRPHVAHRAAQVIQKSAKLPAVREQFWLRLPLLLQKSTSEYHGIAILLCLAAQLNLPKCVELRSTALEPVCYLLPDMVSIEDTSPPWPRIIQAASFRVAKLAVSTANTARDAAGLEKLLRNVTFMETVQTAVNNETNFDENRLSALQLITSMLQFQSRLSSVDIKASVTILLEQRPLILALEGASSAKDCPQRKISLAALHLVAQLPEPCDVPVPGFFAVLTLNENEDFIAGLYSTLHYVKDVGKADDQLSEAAWQAMRTVLGWHGSDAVVATPYTHVLLWESPSSNQEVVRAMLNFTRDWIILLNKNPNNKAKLRLLSTTVEHLLNGADRYANMNGCLTPFIDTITACLHMESDLEPQVAKLARNKVEELRYRS